MVFAEDRDAFLTILHSRVHEIWALFFSSSIKNDLRYSPSDCFVTFPFPPGWEDHPALDATGRAYDAFRKEIMLRNREGLTDTYNRFHDREESSPDIDHLRALHDAMDRAVLDAYGWTDLRPQCEFIRVNDEEEERPEWRYRWPETMHDEVFGRLLKLNGERARAEGEAAVRAVEATGKKPRKKKGDTGQGGLWG